MAWGIFKVYEMIKSIKTPKYILALGSVIRALTIGMMAQLGHQGLENMKSKILALNASNLSNDEKRNELINYSKQLIKDIPDHLRNLIVEIVFSFFKNGKI